MLARRAERRIAGEQLFLLGARSRRYRSFSTDITLASTVVPHAIHQLAFGGLEQPSAEGGLPPILELSEVLEHFSARGLNEVGAGLLFPQHGATAKAHVAPKGRDVSLEQIPDRLAVACANACDERKRRLVHGLGTRGRSPAGDRRLRVLHRREG